MNPAVLDSMMGQPGGAPGAGGPPGAPPAGAAPSRAGPVSVATANPGNRVAAVSKIQTAVSALQESLPDLPLGSDIHNEVLSAVKKLSTVLSKGDVSPDPHAQMQNLVKMAQQATQRPAPPGMNAMMPATQPAAAPEGAQMAA